MKDKALAKSEGQVTSMESFLRSGEVDLARKSFPSLYTSDMAKELSDEAIAVALVECKLKGLNPWGKQAHITPQRPKAGEPPIAIVVTSIHTIAARAAKSKLFHHISDATIVVKTPDGTIKENPGVIPLFAGTPRGAYHDVFFTDGTSQRYTVSIETYKKSAERYPWNQNLYFYLGKASRANAYRQACPGECEGLYERDELIYAEPAQGPNEPAGATTEEQEVYIVQDGEERVPQAIEPPQEAKPEPKPEKPKRGRSSAPPSPKSKPAPQTKAAPKKKEVQSEPLATPPPQEPPSQEANGYDDLVELLNDPRQDGDIKMYWLDRIAKIRAKLAAEIPPQAQAALEEQLRENIKKAAG